MKKPGQKNITLTISEDLHKKIKHHSVESGVSMSAMILKWIETGIKKEIKK